VSPVAAPDRPTVTQVMRPFIMSLTFACIGPAIQAALEAILTVCYLVLSGWGDDVRFTAGIAPRFLWQMVVFAALTAGITGLIAGICETLFGRLNARGMFAVSLVIPFALVTLLIATMPAFRAVIASGNSHAVWIFLGPTAIALLSFVASMMACWKLIAIVRGKTPAAGSLAPR
jgi:hypothetical protein